MEKPANLKELAGLLGLAPSTVSRALKGHPDISKATQERVKAMAEKVHYKPNTLAASLRIRKTHQIAVIIPRITDYFYMQVVHGILKMAYDKQYKVVIFESEGDPQRERAICQFLLKSGVEGVIVSLVKPATDISYLIDLQNNQICIVIFDQISGGINADKVIYDNYSGAYEAVCKMIESGCTKIAHIAGSPYLQWAQKRQLGYIQALQDQHLAIDRELIIECRDQEEIGDVAFKLVEREGVDGLFVVCDEWAIISMRTLKKAGYHIPADVAICGFGNIPFTDMTEPSLTTVGLDGEEMGRIIFEMLLKKLEGTTDGFTETRLLKTRLFWRDSTKPLASLI